MFFKNIKTGVISEITHEDHIKRCKKSKYYEEIKPDKIKAQSKKLPKKVGE